jgi:S-adenosylmethionine decarboxylase
MIFYTLAFAKVCCGHAQVSRVQTYPGVTMHLIIDGYGGDVSKMWDQELVRKFLIDYPTSLGMTRITEPKVLEYIGPKADDVGVSGFVIIAESHISIHTFPLRNYVNIDIFSCKSFDNYMALHDVKQMFSLSEVKTWLLDRGLEWTDLREGLTETEHQRGSLKSGEPSLRSG